MDDNKKMINMMEQIQIRIEQMQIKTEQIQIKTEQIVNDNKKMLNIIEKLKTDVEETKIRLDKLEERMDNIENRMDNMEKTEKAHFEHTCNEFERLEKKIDSNFKNLDEKIDIVKQKTVIEVIDGVEQITATISKMINNVENKINTEIKERKYQIDKLKNLTEYDKIVLKNLESRVSILEEESQKYNGK